MSADAEARSRPSLRDREIGLRIYTAGQAHGELAAPHGERRHRHKHENWHVTGACKKRGVVGEACSLEVP